MTWDCSFFQCGLDKTGDPAAGSRSIKSWRLSGAVPGVSVGYLSGWVASVQRQGAKSPRGPCPGWDLFRCVEEFWLSRSVFDWRLGDFSQCIGQLTRYMRRLFALGRILGGLAFRRDALALSGALY